MRYSRSPEFLRSRKYHVRNGVIVAMEYGICIASYSTEVMRGYSDAGLVNESQFTKQAWRLVADFQPGDN
jgi:hypothetical protein